MKARISRAFTATLFGSIMAANAALSLDADQHHQYYIVGAPLTNLLDMIAQDTGLDIEFTSDSVPYVSSVSMSGDANTLVDGIAQTYNLTRFKFNGRTYLSPSDEQQTRIIANETHSYEKMRDAIEKSGIELEQFTVSETANPNALILTAPPKMVGIVEAIVETLPSGALGKRSSEIVLMRGI